MKALVVTESTEAARELAAGARTLAERVVLICFGDAPSAVADEVVNIDVPAEAVLDDAYETVNAVFDEEEPGGGISAHEVYCREAGVACGNGRDNQRESVFGRRP